LGRSVFVGSEEVDHRAAGVRPALNAVPVKHLCRLLHQGGPGSGLCPTSDQEPVGVPAAEMAVLGQASEEVLASVDVPRIVLTAVWIAWWNVVRDRSYPVRVDRLSVVEARSLLAPLASAGCVPLHDVAVGPHSPSVELTEGPGKVVAACDLVDALACDFQNSSDVLYVE
jgi:hypothetical protein